ncbi:MAG: hypothetical protein PVI78_04515 [Anaerolineales bacterium]
MTSNTGSEASPAANILVVYAATRHPLLASIRDHLFSFRRYSRHRCHYLNVARSNLPTYFKENDFDLVVFHTTFLSVRWKRAGFIERCRQLAGLMDLKAVKIALPQDEFLNADLLCDFVRDFEIDWVFSVAPASEWPKIYAGLDFDRVKFERVLTGYLDEATVRKIDRLAKGERSRPIDIGYRTKPPRFWLGRHGTLKSEMAVPFQEKAPKRGLQVDISTRKQDTILGDDWYRFLLRCKYTIGVEGGATILDRDGMIKTRTNLYLAKHPDASFEEAEAACFPDAEGSLSLYALSPRHLEACATRTCQILVEGEYNGALRPGDHYIELKRDLSNVDQVLDLIKQDRLRQRITETAHKEIVQSGRYSYKSFVEFVVQQSLRDRALASEARSDGQPSRFLYLRMRLTDAWCWLELAITSGLKQSLRRAILAVFPEEVFFRLRRRLRRRR